MYLANTSGVSQAVTLPAAAGNWQGVVSSISNPSGGGTAFASGSAFRTGAGSAAEQRLQALEQQLQNFQASPAQAAATGIQLRSAVYNKVYNIGDSDNWFDHANNVAVTATVLSKVPLSGANPSGPQLYLWADSSQSSKVTPAMVTFLMNNFTQYVAPLETQLIGAPWGLTSSGFGSGTLLPASTADVHLVLASLNQPASVNGLQGFVNTVNVYRKGYADIYNNSVSGCASSSACQDTVTALRNSNEALVTFLNLDTLIYTGGGAWNDNAFGAKQLFFTLAHEYQHLLYNYNKRFSITSANAVPTTWENELASQTMAYLVSAVLYPDPKGGAREHPELVSGGEFEQFLAQPSCDLKTWNNLGTCYYPKAVATGMLMLHQFGPGIFKQWATTPTVGEAALNLGLASVGGGNYSRVMQRLGATLAMTNTTSYPTGYGFPAKSYTVAGIPINLPAVQIPAQKLSLPSSGETYAQSLNLNSTVTVTLPAYSYLSIVKQP